MTGNQNTLDEVIEPVDTEQQDETEVIDQPEGETTEAETGDKLVEPWMETEEEQTEEPEKGTEADKAARGTLKALLATKKRNKEREEALAAELEQARRELERFKSQSITQPDDIGDEPQEWDFETDTEYRAAKKAYRAKEYQTYSRLEREETQRQGAEQRERENVSKALDGHLERADRLIKESGISPEVYAAADTAFRNSVETIMPGRGSAVVDVLISRIGEGSEKVSYYLGRNETARAKFLALMMEDPKGIKASIFLGEQKARLTGAINKQKTSKAPPPAPDVTNGRVATDSAADYKKAYQAASKKDDFQSMLDAKRAARSKGIDVSNW
jgi:hypothetical protein